eukprot:4033695-Prymnesium_polylepis.1
MARVSGRVDDTSGVPHTCTVSRHIMPARTRCATSGRSRSEGSAPGRHGMGMGRFVTPRR